VDGGGAVVVVVLVVVVVVVVVSFSSILILVPRSLSPMIVCLVVCVCGVCVWCVCVCVCGVCVCCVCVCACVLCVCVWFFRCVCVLFHTLTFRHPSNDENHCFLLLLLYRNTLIFCAHKFGGIHTNLRNESFFFFSCRRFMKKSKPTKKLFSCFSIVLSRTMLCTL